MSGVGEATEGAQAPMKMASNITLRKRREGIFLKMLKRHFDCRLSAKLFIRFAGDEGFHFFAADVIAELLWWRLEEVGRGSDDRTSKLALCERGCTVPHADNGDAHFIACHIMKSPYLWLQQKPS
jgi:hypothetical protein